MRLFGRFGRESAAWWPAVLEWPEPESQLLVRPLNSLDERAWSDARHRSLMWLHEWNATVPPGSQPLATTFPELVRVLEISAREGTTMPFVVEVDGVFAGQVTVNNILRGSAQFASIGYWIDRPFAGRGAIPRAVALVIDHCFGPARLHRIEIAIRPENANSLRVVEKLRLREVGLAPRYLHINGDWRDHRVFAVTQEELGPQGMVGRLLASQQSQSHQSQG